MKNSCFFYESNFVIDENIFYPREETEQLVDHCKKFGEFFFGKRKFKILDIGTGSGVIAISLAKIFVQAKIWGVDISSAAIKCGEKNNKKNQTKVQFIQSDMFAKVNQKYDFIVANFPYIAENFVFPKGFKKSDPDQALFGGIDGLKFFQQFFEEVGLFLERHFFIALEFGFDQKESLEKMVQKQMPQSKYFFLNDYAGKNRFLFIYKN